MQSILEQFPKYSDCLLRLASICAARGDVQGAVQRAKEAAAVGGRGAADGHLMAAWLHLNARDWEATTQDLRAAEAVAEAGERDPYVRLMRANLNLYTGPGGKRRVS